MAAAGGEGGESKTAVSPLSKKILEAGCARIMKTFEVDDFGSRTLRQATRRKLNGDLLALTYETCHL